MKGKIKGTPESSTTDQSGTTAQARGNGAMGVKAQTAMSSQLLVLALGGAAGFVA